MTDVNTSSFGSFATNNIYASKLESGYKGPATARPLTLKSSDGLGSTFTILSSTNSTTATLALSADASTIAITGVNAVPSADTDVSNKLYVDNKVDNLPLKICARCTTVRSLYDQCAYNSTTQTLTSTTATSLGSYTSVFDGVILQTGDRVLLKDEYGIRAAINGIYAVTNVGGGVPWVLTRASDANTSQKVARGALVFTTEGSTLAYASFMQVTPNATLGSSALSFLQMVTTGTPGGGGSYTAGNGISIVSNVISVNPLSRLAFNSGALILSSSSTQGDVLVSSGTATTEPSYSAQFGPTSAAAVSSISKMAGVNAISDRTSTGAITDGGFVLRGNPSVTSSQYGPAYYLSDPNLDGSARLVTCGNGSNANIRIEQKIAGVWKTICEHSAS